MFNGLFKEFTVVMYLNDYAIKMFKLLVQFLQFQSIN